MSEGSLNREINLEVVIRATQILLAWEAGALSEEQACKALNMSRVEARKTKAEGIQLGVLLGVLHAQEWSDHAPSCPCAWCNVERDNAE